MFGNITSKDNSDKGNKWVGVVAVHQHIAKGVREWGVEENRWMDQKESLQVLFSFLFCNRARVLIYILKTNFLHYNTL